MTVVTVRKPATADPRHPGVDTAPESEVQHFHFLLLPDFSVMGFVSAMAPLRVANRSQASARAAPGARAKVHPLHGTAQPHG